MDRLLTVVVGRRHQCAGATSAFFSYIISVVVGRRCRRAGATSATSLTSSSFLGVVRHWICGLFKESSILRLTTARSLGQASAGARRPSSSPRLSWAGVVGTRRSHFNLSTSYLHHQFFSRPYDIGSAFSAVEQAWPAGAHRTS